MAATFHPATRMGARIISYLFHPLFIPLYVITFMVYEMNAFPERDSWGRKLVIIQFFVSYTLLPLVTILLLKGLGFIESIHLKSRRDRILPYIVCEVFYFWAWYVCKTLNYPKLVVVFTLAVFLACSLGLLMNIYMKISMHGLAVGTLGAFMVLAGTMVTVNLGFFISIAFLIAGLTATARLIDSDHSTKEVYAGILTGAFMLIVAWWFV